MVLNKKSVPLDIAIKFIHFHLKWGFFSFSLILFERIDFLQLDYLFLHWLHLHSQLPETVKHVQLIFCGLGSLVVVEIHFDSLQLGHQLVVQHFERVHLSSEVVYLVLVLVSDVSLYVAKLQLFILKAVPPIFVISQHFILELLNSIFSFFILFSQGDVMLLVILHSLMELRLLLLVFLL